VPNEIWVVAFLPRTNVIKRSKRSIKLKRPNQASQSQFWIFFRAFQDNFGARVGGDINCELGEMRRNSLNLGWQWLLSLSDCSESLSTLASVILSGFFGELRFNYVQNV
jgi:hypothetical protein